MAKKKTNSIIEEQRRSRQAILDLKKMQEGELDPGKKPSELSEELTGAKKLANYWFHYKWHFLGTIAILLCVVSMVVQCTTKTNYDLSIVYFSYSLADSYQIEDMTKYFDEIAEDINGDGEVHVQIINCSYEKSAANTQLRNNMLARLQAVMVGETDALLYITDEQSIKYFDNMKSEIGIFETEALKLGENFYNKITTSENKLPDDLQISLRRVKGTVLEGKKNVDKVYKESARIIEILK